MTGFSKTTKGSNGAQMDFFGGLPLKTRIITRRKDFEELFDGFMKMRVISYIVSPDLLLDFFEKRGYTEVEIVVGENLSESYKKGLEQKGIEVTEQLAGLVEKSALRIFIPNRTIHTKLYFLEGNSIVRIIQTSANFTETAQEAKRQINYAWYVDLPPGHLVLGQLLKDYESHREGCSLFMEDLTNLLKQGSSTDRKQLIEAWLKGTLSQEEDVEIRGLFHELSANLLEAPDFKEERVMVLKLPESEPARKRIEKYFAPIKPVYAGKNHIQLKTSDYMRHIYEMHRVPLLLLSRERHQLLLGLNSGISTLSEAPSDPSSVDRALELMEGYINTVDYGESTDPLFAKTSMFEALLYVFFSPFAHEYMKLRRNRYGPVDTRGPRYLYIYGPSRNGKSTFLRFSLKLMTGKSLEPLSRQDFTKTKIMSAAWTGTAFPLVFDDVDHSRISGIEEVFKSYWERWWKGEHVSPQIIIASNSPRLQEWAKSRVKRIDFDVHFAPDEAGKAKLAELFRGDNPIFGWLSYLYFKHLDDEELPSDDELLLVRLAIKELYGFASRPLPPFYPAKPVEKLYDTGRKDWRDLLFNLRKASVNNEGRRKLVTLSGDMQHWEINDFVGYLPQTIKYRRKGNTIIVENPKEFDKWLGQPPKARSLLSRFFKGGK